MEGAHNKCEHDGVDAPRECGQIVMLNIAIRPMRNGHSRGVLDYCSPPFH